MPTAAQRASLKWLLPSVSADVTSCPETPALRSGSGPRTSSPQEGAGLELVWSRV